MAEYDNSYMLKARLNEIQANAERIRSSQSSGGFAANRNKQYQKRAQAQATVNKNKNKKSDNIMYQTKLQADYYNNQQKQQLEQAKLIAKKVNQYSDYNNGNQVNSLADILMNKGNKNDKIPSWIVDKTTDIFGLKKPNKDLVYGIDKIPSWIADNTADIFGLNKANKNLVYDIADYITNKVDVGWVSRQLISDTSIDYFKNRSAVSNLFKAADTIVTGGDFAKAKEYGYIAVNNGLVALGEDLDILANPVKSITTNIINGSYGDIREDYLSTFGLSSKYGYGNRKNYDYNTNAKIKIGDVNLLELPSFIPLFGGSNLVDLFLETISDPLNILEMGAGTVAKRGIRNIFTRAETTNVLSMFLQNNSAPATARQINNAQREILQNLLEGKATSLKGAVNNIIKDYTTSNVMHAELNIKPKYDGAVLDYLHILSSEIDDTLVNNVLQGAIGITQAANKLDRVVVHTATAELGLVHPVEWLFKKYKNSNLHIGLRTINKINTNLNKVLSTRTWSTERKEAAKRINLDWFTPDQLENINELFKSDAHIAADKELSDSYAMDIIKNVTEGLNKAIENYNKQLIEHSDDTGIDDFLKALDIKTVNELDIAYQQIFDIAHNLDPELANNSDITKALDTLTYNLDLFKSCVQYKNILNDIGRIGDIRAAIERNVLNNQNIKPVDVLDEELENKISTAIDEVVENIFDTTTQNTFNQAHSAIFNYIYESIPSINNIDELNEWCKNNKDNLDKLKSLMTILYKDINEYTDGHELYITDTIKAIDDINAMSLTTKQIDKTIVEDILNDFYWGLEDVKENIVDTYSDIFERDKALENIDDIIFKDLETESAAPSDTTLWTGNAITDLDRTIKKAHNYIISGKTEYTVNPTKVEDYKTKHTEEYETMQELFETYKVSFTRGISPFNIKHKMENVEKDFYEEKQEQLLKVLKNYFVDEEADITKLPNLTIRRLPEEGEGFDSVWDIIEPDENISELIDLVKKYRNAVTDRSNKLEEILADKDINKVRVYNVVASVEARESAIIEAIGLNTSEGEQKIINFISEMKRFSEQVETIQLAEDVGVDIDSDIMCVQKSFEHWILFSELRNKVTALVNNPKISTYKHRYGKYSNDNERVSKFIIDQLSNYWGESWQLNNILGGKYLTECANAIYNNLINHTDTIIYNDQLFIKELRKIIEEYVGALYKYQAGARFAPNGKDLLDNLKQFKKDANSLSSIGYKFDTETRQRIALTRTDISMSEQLNDGLQDYICNLVDTFTVFDEYKKEHWSDYIVDYLEDDGAVIIDSMGKSHDIIDLSYKLQIDIDNASGYSIIKALTNGAMGLRKIPVENIFIKGLSADAAIPDVFIKTAKEFSATIEQAIKTIRFFNDVVKQAQSKDLSGIYGIDATTCELLRKDNPEYFRGFLPLVKDIITDANITNKEDLLEVISVLEWSPADITDVGSYIFAKYIFNRAVYDIYLKAPEDVTKYDIKIDLCKKFVNTADHKLLTMLIDDKYIAEGALYKDNNYVIRRLQGLEESKHAGTECVLNGITDDTDAALDIQINKTLGAESRNMFYTVHGRLLTYYKDNPKVSRDLFNNRQLLKDYELAKANDNKSRLAEIRNEVHDTAIKDSANNTKVLTDILTNDVDLLQSMLYKSTPGFIVLSPYNNKHAVELQNLFNTEFINKLNNKHIGVRVDDKGYTLYLTKKLDYTKLKELNNYNVLESVKGLDIISNTKFGVKGNITNTRFNNQDSLLSVMKDLPSDFAYTVDDFSLTAPNAFDKGDIFTFNNLSFDNTFFGSNELINNLVQHNTDWDFTRADNMYATFVDNISANTAAQLLFNYDLRPKLLDVLKYAPSITDETIRDFFKEHKEYVALYYEVVNNEAKPRIIKLNSPDLTKNITQLNPILITKIEADNIIKSSRHSLAKRSLGFECLATYSSVLKASYLSTVGLVYRNFTSTITKAVLDAAQSSSDYITLVKEAQELMKDSMQKMNRYQECYLEISKWVTNNGYASVGSEGTHITKALTRKFFKDPANAKWIDFIEDYKYIDDWTNAGYTSTLTKILEDQERNEVLKGVGLINSIKHTGERINKSYPNANALEKGVHAFNQLATDIAWKNPWTKFITSTNNGIEAYSRFFTFEWNLRHGSDAAQAAEHVRAAHFDYDATNDLADIMNTIIPFINFRMANTTYWLDELYSNPMLTKLIMDSFKDNGLYDHSVEELIDQDNFIEQLFSGLVPTSIDGLYFKLNGDYLDALRFVANPVDNILDSLLGLKTLITYKEYDGARLEIEAEYENWKKQLALYRQFQNSLDPKYKRSEEKIAQERKYFEERLAYNNYCKKDLLINLIPFVNNVRKLGLFDMLDDLDADVLNLSRDGGSSYDVDRTTNGAQIAFAELYRGIADGDKQLIATALSKGMSSLFTKHDKRYYFSYGNMNASTSDYNKYLEHLSKGAKEGWAGVTQELAVPKQYYAVAFTNTGKSYMTTKEATAIKLIASGATPLNDEAKLLSIGVDVQENTYNFKYSGGYQHLNKRKTYTPKPNTYGTLNMAKTQAFYSTKPSKAKPVYSATNKYYSRFNNSVTQTQTKTYTQTRTQTRTSTENLLRYGYYRPASARSISTSAGKNKRSRG